VDDVEYWQVVDEFGSSYATYLTKEAAERSAENRRLDYQRAFRVVKKSA
jgi:hypothetical protein